MSARSSSLALVRFGAVAALITGFSNGCAIGQDPESSTGGKSALGGTSSGFGGSLGTGGAVSGKGGSTFVSGGGPSGGSSPGNGGSVPATSGGSPPASGGKAALGGGGAFGLGGGSSGGSAAGGAATGGAGLSGASSTAGGGVGGGAGAATAGTSGAAGGSGCDWMSTECATKQCAKGCTANDGGYCAGACNTIITCLQANPGCGTASDPMCVQRGKSTGTPNKCTMQWESAGGGSLPLQGPALAAVGLFECACAMMIPTSGTGGSGAGGASGKASAGGTSGKAGS